MIAFQAARARVLACARPLEAETQPLEAALGCYLAETVAAPFDVPRFDNSAMDGYGVRAADVAGAAPDWPARLRVVGTVAAGDSANTPLLPGHAVKILTGAPIPPGVEAVIMKEECEEVGGEVCIRRAIRPGESIRRRGEEFAAGDVVLPQGTRVTPAAIGLLAGFGFDRVRVHRRPQVALLVTGNELVLPGEALTPGGVYDANSYSLRAALREAGVGDVAAVRVRDDRDALREHLGQAVARADVVLVAGGVSVGDYDFVKDVCVELGVDLQFTQVAMKPGKPVTFGTRVREDGRTTLVFGLPGNPVSALVAFLEFVRPALHRLMGALEDPCVLLPATLGVAYRKAPSRLELVRGACAVEDGRLVVYPTTGQGSHMLGGMARANCLIHLPAGAAELGAGAPVQIELL